MSDDEEVYSEEEEEEEAPARPPQRKVQISSEGLDEVAKELLAANAAERDQMAAEIEELRKRSEERKKQRAMEEKELTARRQEDDARRKQEEEERRRQKEEAEKERKRKLAEQMAEYEKTQSSGGKNFVIVKKSDKSELVGGGGDDEEEDDKEKYMSREQLEQERKAIMSQRIVPLEIDGLDAGKLANKAESLFREILRLEGEKYDLEKRFKAQQLDMMEMGERARSMNQVGKTGLKRIAPDETDIIAQKYSGAPGKIIMYSKFERQQDGRSYVQRHDVFGGPMYGAAAERIKQSRKIVWDEWNPPVWTGLDGGKAAPLVKDKSAAPAPAAEAPAAPAEEPAPAEEAPPPPAEEVEAAE